MLRANVLRQKNVLNSKGLMKPKNFVRNMKIINANEKQTKITISNLDPEHKPVDFIKSPENLKQLGEYFRTQRNDPLSLQFIPSTDNPSLIEMSNYSPALQNLMDLGVVLPKITTKELDYSYGFLTRLTQEELGSAIKFISFDCGLDFKLVPQVLTYAPELLNPELDRDAVLKTVEYLRDEVGLDFGKLVLSNKSSGGIGIRSIIEYQGEIGIGHLDYLLYQTKNLKVLELSGQGRESDTVIALTDTDLLNMIYKVPELIVPSFLTFQDVQRTIQLIARHLTKDFSLLERLVKNMPRELFYTRVYGERKIEPWEILLTIQENNLIDESSKVENLKNEIFEKNLALNGEKPALLGYRFQSNWKLLVFDMQLSDEKIVKNLFLMRMDTKVLQKRAHFLRLRKQVYVLFNEMAMDTSDRDFCEFLGIEVEEYDDYLKNFFL